METIICDDEELISAISEFLDVILSTKISNKETFSMGLSGGSIVGILAKVLLNLSEFRYNQIHFFFCDERFVNEDSNDFTFKLFNEAMFSKRHTPMENIHKVNFSLDLEESTKEYKKDIENYFRPFLDESSQIPKFDILFLGLGPDGHTASLFPNHKLLKDHHKLVACLEDSPKPPNQRITMTLPLINSARNICLISVGQSKASIVQTCITEFKLGGSDQYPASLVRPYNGRLIWFLNKESAQLCNELTINK